MDGQNPAPVGMDEPRTQHTQQVRHLPPGRLAPPFHLHLDHPFSVPLGKLIHKLTNPRAKQASFQGNRGSLISILRTATLLEILDKFLTESLGAEQSGQNSARRSRLVGSWRLLLLRKVTAMGVAEAMAFARVKSWWRVVQGGPFQGLGKLKEGYPFLGVPLF